MSDEFHDVSAQGRTCAAPRMALLMVLTACGAREVVVDDAGSTGWTSPSVDTSATLDLIGMSTSTSTSTDPVEDTMSAVDPSSTGASGSGSGEGPEGGDPMSSTGGSEPSCLAETCTQVEAPVCDPERGTCVGCGEVDAPDEACRRADPATPICAGDRCVACTSEDPGACEDSTPVCLDAQCVECTPENTMACDEASPVCGVGNLCVPCSGDDRGACEGATPVCEDERCVPCEAHAECPASACDLETGACLPTEYVWHVDGATSCSENGDGSEDDPRCLSDALAQVATVGEGTLILHSSTDHEGAFEVSAGTKVALLTAPEATQPRLLAQAGSALTVGAGATVYLGDGLVIRSLEGDGLEVSGVAYAEDILISGNGGGGVRLLGEGRMQASRSRILDNAAGGILVLGDPDAGPEAGPFLRLENVFVAQLPSRSSGVHAVVVTGGTVDIVYSTLSAAPTDDLESRALHCEGAPVVRVRNSLLVSVDPGPAEVDCVGLDALHNAAHMDLGESNVALGWPSDDEEPWFRSLSSGDLSLDHPPEPLVSAARWEPGDPTTDIDGDLRPIVSGAHDAAGADRLAGYSLRPAATR